LKDAKATVQAIQATIDAKLDIANRGWEHRDVECEWVAVGDGREALLRSDTGEAIEARETPRQRELLEELESINERDGAHHNPKAKSWMEKVKDFFGT
jgi:hypothetical protein